jgi:hypothetical protein
VDVRRIRPAAALALTLSLGGAPASVDAAGSWSVSVLTDSCTDHGGKYGNGRLIHRVRGTETGSTGTQRMRLRVSVQEWDGTRWVTLVSNGWSTSDRIPMDRETHRVTWGAVRWDTPDFARTKQHRLRSTVQFLRKGKPQRTIHTYSRSC